MIKTILSCLKKYQKESYFSAIFMVLEVFVEVAIPLLMGLLIDQGIEKGSGDFILKIGLILLALSLISLLFGVLSASYSAIAASGLAHNIRSMMYHNISNFSFENIDKFSTASLITRITTDVTNIRNAYQAIIRQAVRAPIMLLLCLILTFTINVQIAFIFLALVPILGGGLFLVVWKAHPLFEKVFQKYDKLNQVVGENLRGIRVVKSFVREEQQIQQFTNDSQDIYQNFSKAERIVSWNSPLMQICSYASILLIAWIGAKLIVNRGNLTTGQLMSLIGYAMQILMSLMLLSFVLVMIVIASTSASRVVEVLKEKSTIVNGDEPILEISEGSIEFRQVNFSYVGDLNKLCLTNLNFKIASGQTVAIVGSTGSGKTSLINLICRLYDATSGEVLVGGVNVKEYDLDTLRQGVAVVLQKNVLFRGSIRENLSWGNPQASLSEMDYYVKISQAQDFINNLENNYETLVLQGGSNFSGGQKQRLCLARALLKQPKILILDDSTSAIDTKTEALIHQALRDNFPKMTKIIIAQRLSSIQEAQQIIVLNDGQIMDIGSHHELMQRNTIYQEIAASQFRGDFDE
ncbi:MAG: ABC transporter ATP-binding protein/permease [Acholeplasmatales bacterium]|jgi:ATP-binding cassette subfamily B protein|nr:ABC transporter ATP-binding protein/permease [Acholeplasmatales bacterium]